MRAVDSSIMVTHPYSIHIWHSAYGVRGQLTWYEALQAYTEDDALYTANVRRFGA